MQIGTAFRENRATILCAVVIAVLLAILTGLLYGRSATSAERLVALVHDSDGQTHTLPLDTDTTVVIETELGRNTIAIRDGAVLIEDADCPNGTCMQHAPLSEPGGQIICLPHQLWIEVVPEGSEGGTMDVSLAEGDQDVDLVSR